MSLVGFPLLLIPLAIINILVFLMPGVSFTDPLVSVRLLSGAVWKVTFSDVLLALSVVLVLFEVMKASRPQGRYFTDHLLSFLAFAAAAAEFLLLPQFAISVVFLLAVMMAVEFLAGISLRLRRGPAAARRAARREPEDTGFVPVAANSRVEPVVPSPLTEPAGVQPVAPSQISPVPAPHEPVSQPEHDAPPR